MRVCRVAPLIFVFLAALPARAAHAQAPKTAAKQQKGTGEAWQIITPPQSSLVYARDGTLIGEIGAQWRTNVPVASLPKYVGEAFIAVEDKRFYQHNGVDVVGIAGAIKDNLLGSSRGASTITQLLVGNMHPDLIDRRDRSGISGIERKLKEQSAAREMERHYNKQQILEAFLNQINFGHGWYGIESAAQHYFGKPAAQLTIAEAATLAALPKGPAIYDPARYPDRAKNRRDAILGLMADQKYITRAQAAAAKAQPVRTVPDGGVSAPSSYFVDVVRTRAERAGIPVSKGGYRIYTTLDPALQRAAVRALADGAAEVERRPGYPNPTYASHPKGSTDYLQGAVVAIDPSSGDVKALVGGRNYQESPFDRAVSGLRQPGSSFKPFVYGRALMDSLPANAIVADTAINVEYDDQSYSPRNADDKFLGDMTLREALTLSRNPVAVQLWMKYGADSIIALARRFGITTPIAPYPASAIGASEVQPLEFVAAFTALDNLGTPMVPRFVYRVEDRAGKTVWAQEVRSLPPALDPRVTFILRDMMRDVVERGTATPVRRFLPETVPVAGKTGTTDDNTDVWFVGATPEIVAGVWLGFDKPRPIAEHGVAGGSLAAPVFAEMLAQAGYTHPTAAWDVPPGLITAELDRSTGKLADATTPPDRRYTEYFLPGTEPGALRIDARRLFVLGPIMF
ncbi:MAG: transglycosylase domain-containing protein [Gemmatimonadaceae bacterium]